MPQLVILHYRRQPRQLIPNKILKISIKGRGRQGFLKRKPAFHAKLFIQIKRKFLQNLILNSCLRYYHHIIIIQGRHLASFNQNAPLSPGKPPKQNYRNQIVPKNLFKLLHNNSHMPINHLIHFFSKHRIFIHIHNS